MLQNFINKSIFISLISMLLPAVSAAASSDGVVVPTVNCQNMMNELNRKIQKEERYKAVREALEADPNQKCQLNRAAQHDRNYGLIGQQYLKSSSRECGPEDQSLCLSTYVRVRASLEEYKKLLKAGCEIAGASGQKCASASSTKARFNCVAAELDKAAAAEKKALAAIEQAEKDAGQFQKLTSELNVRYKKDQSEISRFQGEDLTTATAIRDGHIERGAAAPKSIMEQLQEKEKLYPVGGPVASNSTVLANLGGAQNLQGYYQNAEQLAGEQAAASRVAGGFQSFAKEEADYRRSSMTTLQEMAAENRQRALRSDDVVKVTAASSKVTNGGNSTSASSSLPNLNNAMAMTQAGAGLANTMNAQNAAASAASQIPSNSVWQDVASAVQNATGLSSSTSPGTAKLDGTNPSPGGSVSPDGPAHPEQPGLNQNLAFNPGSGALSNGDTFVSGNGDLPAEAATSASRALASEMKGKLGGPGADAKTYGKKRKGGSGEEDGVPCAPGQDCAALAAASGSQFQKGGSLGVPVVGASDPALAAAGALDNLFGPLPGMDAAGNPVAAGPLPGGTSWSMETELALGASESTDTRQVQAEVAPANSRSLFMRVRVAHEKALKKGAVSLFHKKL